MKAAPVFDRSKWPELWQKARQQSLYKPRKGFIKPDKYDRIIKGVGYVFHDSLITAHLFDGSEIGFLSINDNWLDQVEVKKAFRRKGIAKCLMRLAVKQFGHFKIACVQVSRAYEYSLTKEGALLVANCLDKRIVSLCQCRGPWQVPLATGAFFNPGLAVPELARFTIREDIPLSPTHSV